MNSKLLKILAIAAVSLLSACSGVTTSSCFSANCQSLDGRNANKFSFGTNAIGNNFNEYSSGLLHDD
ncbi:MULTISPECIES: hypothetical protein [Pseudomonas]|uniref:Lipoprotein n=1 Tax=Pseudomonas koreensis TaxID=198620 RepID=A0A9X2XKZ1_9PSED|nr:MULTISPECIES: hypothetical protein [Pseudomonas]MBV4475251.1 hypothetical protein [Pseudomonas botevensis]MCU7250349.1 hypothetical protein [Pseudomonas koreensis]